MALGALGLGGGQGGEAGEEEDEVAEHVVFRRESDVVGGIYWPVLKEVYGFEVLRHSVDTSIALKYAQWRLEALWGSCACRSCGSWSVPAQELAVNDMIHGLSERMY